MSLVAKYKNEVARAIWWGHTPRTLGWDNGLDTDLRAFYPLNETSGDALDVISSHTGVETGGTVASGSDDHVYGYRDLEAGDTEGFLAAHHDDLSFLDTSFTVAVLVWLESTLVSSLIYKGGSNDLEYDLGFDTVRFRFRVSSGAGFVNLTTVTANTYGVVPIGRWHFVVGRHHAGNNTIDISVNAGASDSVGYSAGSYNSGGGLFLGYNPFAEYYDGRMSKAILLNRYVSDVEVMKLYRAYFPSNEAEIIAKEIWNHA